MTTALNPDNAPLKLQMKTPLSTHPARLAAIVLMGALTASPAAEPKINRHALVTRHNIVWNELTGVVPLGNGEFCFGADATGLQTFGGNSMSHWGWHSFPLPPGWTPDRVPATGIGEVKAGGERMGWTPEGTFKQGRSSGPDMGEIREWVFNNPHILNLGRLRLCKEGNAALATNEISEVSRTLALWSGAQVSTCKINGEPVRVETCVHPQLDAVAVRIESPLIARGALQVSLDFGYPTLKDEAWVGDFSRRDGHETECKTVGAQRVELSRKVDDTTYSACLSWSAGAKLATAGKHQFLLSATGSNRLDFICAFSPAKIAGELPTVAKTFDEAAKHWEKHWNTGGAIDLSGSKDPRWRELERRIVLSQYLMAAMSAGSWPSSEAGLLGIDPWRGQFHMEMVWWHLAHYALWDRWAMAEQSLGCYPRFESTSRQRASQTGYKGLMWPKSVGPEGRSAPWIGNLVLLWRQPHPIFFAELEYRLHPNRATLEKWRDIVFGTAENIADYPTRDPQTGIYSLTPAMPPSEEGITCDPVFDLAYWRWALDKAQEWRQRLGLAREPHWDEVRMHLAPLPVSDGVFLSSPKWPDTYTKRASGHPDPVGVLGMLPPMSGVDAETAHRTVRKIWETWHWNRTWGWDCPWMAMAAARVGEPQLAVEALLKDSAPNQFDQRGVNTGGPCPYLPGNGGLLYAVAMMAAGWDGCPATPSPGFPQDGSWVVRWEGLSKAP